MSTPWQTHDITNKANRPSTSECFGREGGKTFKLLDYLLYILELRAPIRKYDRCLMDIVFQVTLDALISNCCDGTNTYWSSAAWSSSTWCIWSLIPPFKCFSSTVSPTFVCRNGRWWSSVGRYRFSSAFTLYSNRCATSAWKSSDKLCSGANEFTSPPPPPPTLQYRWELAVNR